MEEEATTSSKTTDEEAAARAQRDRVEARRRGVRVAAQVAAIGSLLAASAGLVRAEEPRAGVASAAQESAADPAVDVAALVAVRSAGNCGCSPCWGPPAPPPMPGAGRAALATAVSA